MYIHHRNCSDLIRCYVYTSMLMNRVSKSIVRSSITIERQVSMIDPEIIDMTKTTTTTNERTKTQHRQVNIGDKRRE